MAHGSLLPHMKSLLPSLSVKEQEIARYILENPKEASRMTISEISANLGMADSTIFKFTKKLGYRGFRDFRNDLLSEEYDPQVSVHENVSASDTTLQMARSVFQSSVKSLNDTISLIDEKSLDRAVDIIMNSSTLAFFGCGGSNVVAMDAYQKFLRSPVRVEYTTDLHMQLMQASLLREDDGAILITHTGLSRDTINIARIIKERKVKTIVITSYPSPQIERYADVSLVSAAEETGFRSESLSSRISQLAIIDSLFTAVMFKMPRAAESLHDIRDAISYTKVE